MSLVEHPLNDKTTFGCLMSYEDQLLNNSYDSNTISEIVNIYTVFLSEFDFILRPKKRSNFKVLFGKNANVRALV